MIGWYRQRRNTGQQMTLKEQLVHQNLRKLLPYQELIFLLLTPSEVTASRSTHRLEYTAFIWSGRSGQTAARLRTRTSQQYLFSSSPVENMDRIFSSQCEPTVGLVPLLAGCRTILASANISCHIFCPKLSNLTGLSLPFLVLQYFLAVIFFFNVTLLYSKKAWLHLGNVDSQFFVIYLLS